ncbi:unnamed protein product [Camellia sinensis]
MKCMSGADVVGKSKGLQWMYIPAFIGKILNQLMEDDDEVDVSMDAGEAFRVFTRLEMMMMLWRGELEKAIKGSRSSIIVFSKDYASSQRCLDELVMILECKRNFKHVILPVFYGYEAQFEVEIDERNGKLGMEKVEGWRKALREVVDLGDEHDRLLKVHDVCEVSMVKEFNDVEALRLFSWHAFGQDHPIEAYIKQAKRMTYHYGGLPLALEVLGASLFGKSVDAWENALAKLGSFFDEKIQNVLQISYDSLDDHDKNLFLDIACFFVEKEKDFAVKILDECDYHTTIGIQYLIRRCLETIDGVVNKLMMHQLLRDMGREIIRQESPKEPGKRSRVWRHKDAYNVLKEKTGTKTIKGFILDLCVLREDVQGKSVNNTQHHHFDDFMDDNLSKHRRLEVA